MSFSTKRFVKFVEEHKILLIFSVLVTIVSYVLYLVNAEDILTDSETYIMHMPETLTVFERVGRFGLFVTKKIFSTDSYIPSVFICYMMITMALTAMIFDFLVLEIVDSEHKGLLEPFFFVFNGLFISCPVLVHQFYFYYQAFEVAFAFLLGILAAGQIFAWIRQRGNIIQLLSGLVCMIWSFSTYQAMVPFYIAVNAIFFFFLYLYGEKRSSYFKDCIKLIVIFLIGLVGYLISGRLWLVLRHYPAATALDDSYFCWGKYPVNQCLNLIRMDMMRVFTHESLVFNKYHSLFTGAFVIWAIWKGKCAGKKGYALFLISVAIMVFSPFLMSIMLGNCQIIRGHLVYPLVFASTAGIVAMFVADHSPIKYPVYALLVIMLFSQIDIANRYEQTIHFTADADRRLVQEIYTRTEMLQQKEAGGGEESRFPLVFVGKYAPPRPGSYIEGWDATGISYFEIDAINVGGSKRIACLMNAMGLPAVEPTQEQYDYACQRAESMEVWPGEDACVCENGMIIVKMGE